MDPRFRGLLTSPSGFHLGNQSSIATEFPDQTIIANGPRFEITFPDHKLVNQQMNHIIVGNMPFTNAAVEEEDDCRDDLDFSDAMLQYIDQILMEEEEDMADKTHMLQESLDLQAKERSFYEVLGEKYPPSPQPSDFISRENPNSFLYTEPLNSRTSSSDGSGYLIDIVDPSWNSRGDGDVETFLVGCHPTSHVSRSSIGSSTNFSSVLGGISDSPVSPLQLRNAYSESQSVWSFMKGAEEANKFLPSGNRTIANVNVRGLSVKDLLQIQPDQDTVKLERRGGEERLLSESRRKKNCHVLETDLEEERSSKLPATSADTNPPVEEFDKFLLHTVGEDERRFAAYREGLNIEASNAVKQNRQVKTLYSSGSGRGKKQKQKQKKEVIDLRTLLISCAQAVAADDRRNSNELLQQIRKHSSPFGDGNQRLAYYFADGLEARLAGTGSQIHKALVNKGTTVAVYLKAYYTYLACSPFRKISNFASNKTIINSSLKSMRVHVIDFGILYGFQYPTLIQKLSERDGGPPRLRITGVDFPQPGFRPAERIEETGRRLARYAEKFNVPFEYNAIVKSWENIKVEDLKIEEGEFVAVVCLYRTRNLLDETVVAESSRTKVLNMIRKINPSIFIHGIVNGAYSAPFFVTRFREVLFHFSALFDMLENNVPRDKPERLLIEKDIFAREAMNVIACEGWERVERPETYKQWQVRDMRAGFLQIPFRRDIMNGAIQKVSALYHKDFVIDEDSKWMLLGWKGRIIYAISCWKPV